MRNGSFKISIMLAVLWTLLFLIDKQIHLMDYFAGRGMNNIENEYYRLITCPWLHFNLIHLIVNVIAIIYVGHFIDRSLGSIKVILFVLNAGFITDLIYACIFKNSGNFFGGSIYVFALLGLIVILERFRADFPRFYLGTRAGDYLVMYGILGNIPVLSFMDFGTVAIHLIAFMTGIVLGILGILFGIL